MTLKQDNHALNALAEEVGMYAVRDEGPRVQDGASYFHGIWNDSRFASKPITMKERPVKCGEVVIDANGVEHRREWETDVSVEDFMAGIANMLATVPPMPSEVVISPAAMRALGRVRGIYA